MAALAQTIAIVDRSGKVVSTSKQLKNVFKEAKLAYQERKAEIAAERKDREDRELRKALKAMSIADEERSEASRAHSRSRRRRSHRPESERRPSAGVERGYSDASGQSSPGGGSRRSPPRSPWVEEAENENYGSGHSEHDYYAAPHSRDPGMDLVRRRTDLEIATTVSPARPPRTLARTQTSPALDTNIDMDLAYGEFHPDSISPITPVSPRGLALTKSVQQKEELSSLVLKCKMLLDEANCAQHSAKAVMAHLQSNPDAMAAVALTLAEISNVASKMAPGALTMLKASAPAVFGLLAAPEFLIAVGVSVGITIVMFGGYKIIKKIQAARGDGAGEKGMDEMIDVEELSHIEQWRRGIADDQFDDTSSVAGSVATSVEGEFITPFAQKSMGHLPMAQKTRSKGEKKEKKERKEREKKDKKRSKKGSEGGSEGGSVTGSSRAGSSAVTEREKAGKAMIKVKKPSPLRRMFNSGSTDRGSSVAA